MANAKEMYERALRTLEGALGPFHPHVAVALNSLGIMFHRLCDWPHAIELLERARIRLHQLDAARVTLEHALALAESSRKGFLAMGATACTARAERWLSDHP